MRKRARARDREDEDGEDSGLGREKEREGGSRKQRRECSVTDASGHINFFSDLQKGVRISKHLYILPLHTCNCTLLV